MAGLREKKKMARKDRIFSSAVDLFNKKGFANTSMQDIAEKSNLAVGTLYNYFSSKHDLLLDIIHEQIEFTITDHEEFFRVNLIDRDAKDVIKSLVRKIFSAPLLVNKERMKDILIAIFSSDVHLKKGMLLDIELMHAFEKLLKRLKERNMISSELDTLNATKIFYSILMIQMMIYIFEPEFNSDLLFENTDELIDLTFQGLEP